MKYVPPTLLTIALLLCAAAASCQVFLERDIDALRYGLASLLLSLASGFAAIAAKVVVNARPKVVAREEPS